MTAKRQTPAAPPVDATVASFPWMTTEEAARYLRVQPGTLANWRVAGKGPRYSDKTGRPLYRLSELDAWLAGGLRSSTTEPPALKAS